MLSTVNETKVKGISFFAFEGVGSLSKALSRALTSAELPNLKGEGERGEGDFWTGLRAGINSSSLDSSDSQIDPGDMKAEDVEKRGWRSRKGAWSKKS